MYQSFSQIKTIAFCRRHQAEEVMVKIALLRSITIKKCQNWSGNFTSISSQYYHVHFASSCKYHIQFKTMTEFQLRAK